MIKVVTHNGSFHADDVFAVAAFQLLLGKENIEVIRTRDEDLIASADYVVDVGGLYDHEAKRYDHHQNGAPVRENGIPYAGFGLMWRHYGEEICGNVEVAQKIEEKLCIPIDAGDNAVNIWQPGQFDLRAPEWDSIVKTWRAFRESDEDMDEQFMLVVEVARTYLERVIKKELNKLEDKKRAEALYEAAEDKTVIVTDDPVSREWYVEKPEVLAVVHPRDTDPDGPWMAVLVETGEVDYQTKVRFPETWAGLKNEVLAGVSGLPDAMFCHKHRYLFVAESKESAVAAAKLAT